MKKLLSVLLALVLVLAFVACDAETEPVRESNKQNNTPASFDPAETTERVIKEGDTIIVKVCVYHGNGEITDTRVSALYGQTLTEVLLERTFITGDMKTVDGEHANAEEGATWSLYVDGVFTTEAWDTIVLENNSEYTFEYTLDVSLEGDVDGEFNEEEVQEEAPEEDLGAPETDVTE